MTAPPPSPTASSLPGPRPGPAPGRLGVLCRARHLGRQVRPPAAAGRRCTAWNPPDFAAAAGGSGPRGRKKPLPPNPEPDETLVLPDTPLYGSVRAEAWHRVHPLIHGDRGWFAGRKNLPVLPGTLVHVTVDRLPDGRDPHRATWLWHAGPAPCRWTSSGAPTSPGSTSSTPSSSPREPSASPPRSPDPSRPTAGPGSSWPLTPSFCSPCRWPPTCAGLEETARPRPAADTGPGPPRVSQFPPRPGNTRPCRETLPPRARQAQRQRQRPSSPPFFPGEADMPRTVNTTLTRQKVKT